QRLADALQGLGRGALAQDGAGRVARQGPDEEKDKRLQPEQDRDQQEQAPQDELTHETPSKMSGGPRLRAEALRVYCLSRSYSLIDTVAKLSEPVGLASKPWTSCVKASAGS